MSENNDSLPSKIINLITPKKFPWWKVLLIVLAGLVGLCLILSAVIAGYLFYFKDKVYPGVMVNNYSFGGMKSAEVKDFIENFNNRITKEGVTFKFKDKNNQTVDFKVDVISADDSSVELVYLDSAQISASVMQAGRQGNFWQTLWAPFYIRFARQKVVANLQFNDKFMDGLETYLMPYEDKPHEANVKITGLNPFAYNIISEKKGVVFDYDRAKKNVENNLLSFSLAPVEIVKKDFSPSIFTNDLSQITSKLPEIFSYGGLGLNYIDSQTKYRQDWTISPNDLADWIEARKADNGEFIFGLNADKVKKYLETLRPKIDTTAQNSKFTMADGKVSEFQAGQNGVSLNTDKTYTVLDAAFRDRNYRPTEPIKTVSVSTDVTEPDIKISDINNLGITDLIGSGFSTFKDSHTNRIKNIAHAVQKLNGVIIAPGEIFSTNKYAGPFTLAEGYWPEMVIKGKEIKAEVGGGMCQIGTTLFRMAMNSGMPITERRNHSLVVSYYADPVNHNPGTDATVYEPLVDFRFLNDTGGYLLLQTSIDYTKQLLTFSLWGKSDGRKGWYTHPIVSKWIPAGAPEEIITNTLAPGEKKCQAAFRGAVASFTYTRITSSSQQIEQVFDSYYRPLPQICQVGASVSTATIDVAPLSAVE